MWNDRGGGMVFLPGRKREGEPSMMWMITLLIWIAVALVCAAALGFIISIARRRMKGYVIFPSDHLLWVRPKTPEQLSEEAVLYIHKNSKCPFCASELFEGPTGGINMNLFCGNPDCNSRFNITLPGFVGFGGADAPIPAWGEFTGECPADFLEWRRNEQRKE